MSQRVLFGAIVFLSFVVGLSSPQSGKAGPWGMACTGTALCPDWKCTYRTTGGTSSTCTTCNNVTTTCPRTKCGWCEPQWFSYFCCQMTECEGQDLDNGGLPCKCNVRGNPTSDRYCQRRQTARSLFASW
jgi:hypothetical protein